LEWLKKLKNSSKAMKTGIFQLETVPPAFPWSKRDSFSGLMIFWLLTGRVCSDFPNNSTNCDGAAE